MVRVEGLTKRYGAVRALRGVSFTVDRGEVVGLLGPNGAGKTTTMRILTGYVAATSGRALVDGVDVAVDPLAVKRMVGYLPEFAPLYAEMLVHDYLQYAGAVHGMRKRERQRRIGDLVPLCGLADVIHRPFRELSRGYKQRVGLAHALIADPDLLVLDEPTAGLDPNQIVEIRSIIRAAGERKAIVFSTHILSEAESTCQRIVIIDRGAVVADGTAAELTRGRSLEERFRELTAAGGAARDSAAGDSAAGDSAAGDGAGPPSGSAGARRRARRKLRP